MVNRQSQPQLVTLNVCTLTRFARPGLQCILQTCHCVATRYADALPIIGYHCARLLYGLFDGPSILSTVSVPCVKESGLSSSCSLFRSPIRRLPLALAHLSGSPSQDHLARNIHEFAAARLSKASPGQTDQRSNKAKPWEGRSLAVERIGKESRRS